jgi:EAL domain-containing protein (putative c-di-GMP-specific phosphodiesterase class I)
MLNDTFGVEYGDSLLRWIAERISGLAEVQFAARLWADQYAFIIDLGQSTLADAIQEITQPVVLNGVRNLLSACAGMAHFATGAEADDLIANATIALKRAKLSGHGSHIVFATDMVEALRARSKMLALLKHDFDQGLFHLEYQPQVRADNQKIIGVEALCRWTNSEGQRIGPDVFIPLAEQSGLILALGEWVLKQALRDLKTLREQEPNLRMAVNVSALQFKDPDFEHILTTSLQEAGLSGNCLDVEITESVGMMGSAEVEAKFARIKQQGVMISIDDFGTGFSSLSYLDQLSADQLKIDRSFVEKLQLGSDSNIAKMIVDLGLMLKLEVLAEGVETEEQLKILAGLGCHYAQGYLFSRPLRLEDLLKWMKV